MPVKRTPRSLKLAEDEMGIIRDAAHLTGSPSPHAFMRDTVLRRARAVVAAPRKRHPKGRSVPGEQA
jgi:uncharacterized protein (DUF1778 family)